MTQVARKGEQLELMGEWAGLGTMTLQERFELFHSNNPEVYETLVRLARTAKTTGRSPGIKMLFEVARWEVFMKTKGDEYKLNNNYHSRYARLIMEQERDLAGFFETRMLKAA